jgi:hypothetical protein
MRSVLFRVVAALTGVSFVILGGDVLQDFKFFARSS